MMNQGRSEERVDEAKRRLFSRRGELLSRDDKSRLRSEERVKEKI